MNDLTRTYRPTSFDEVIGHEDVCASIERTMTTAQTRAFLFTGPSGVGKTTLARIIATEAGADLRDVMEVDAATHSGIADVKTIVGKMAYRGFGKSGVRVCIVDECHSLSKTAWQALLKAIEEPSETTWWILCTTELAKVPDTIVTRCLHYDLKPVHKDAMFDFLHEVVTAEGLDTDDGILDVVVRHADGSPRQALRSLQVVAHMDDRKAAARLLGDITSDDGGVRGLCQALNKGTTWAQAMKHVSRLDGIDGESVRIQIVRYFEKVARGSESDHRATSAVAILEAFENPYPRQNGQASLLVSLGQLLLGE